MEYRVRKRSIDRVGSTRPVEEILSSAMMRRFHLRAGFTTTSLRALEHTQRFYCDFLQKLLDAAVTLKEHDRRVNMRLTDVLRACGHYGIRVYGYDDMCVVEGPWGLEEFHVTELVECTTAFGQVQAGIDGATEPDQEPRGWCKKTDFVQNQLAAGENADEEDEWSSDDSEWSWYGDSDAESDDEDSLSNVQDDVETPRPVNRWQKRETASDRLLTSLSAAQEFVDNELLVHEPEAEIFESDEPMGQGYYSDCDNTREPVYSSKWGEGVDSEEQKWIAQGATIDFLEDRTNGHSDSEDMEDDLLDNRYGDANQYVLSRQVFMEVFHSMLRYNFNVSAVALSALHNVSEQCLHTSLVSGILRDQVVSILMEEHIEATSSVSLQLEEQRQKVMQAESEMLEMRAFFKSKELEMQRQIEDLERRVRQYEGNPANLPIAQTQKSDQKKSPGKRKATSKDVPAHENVAKPSVTYSIVGSLRSRLHEYGLRKKARISPV